MHTAKRTFSQQLMTESQPKLGLQKGKVSHDLSLSSHEDFNTDKVGNSVNPTQVGFVHMYEHCYSVTHDIFYVMFHWES